MNHNEHYARANAMISAVEFSKAAVAGGGHVTTQDLIDTAEAIFGFVGVPDDGGNAATQTQPIAPEDDIGF